ncbi:MAG: type II toxin-antitoxin system HicB family antitoxin [Flavobacteriales bacterium]|nr:type II toxin-antitoxin system HicB family antitoxin [Flavobacteriales bacterium]
MAVNHTLQVIIEHDKDGYFAYVPELKGCHSQGDSMEEVMKNIKEAIDLYWSTLG